MAVRIMMMRSRLRSLGDFKALLIQYLQKALLLIRIYVATIVH